MSVFSACLSIVQHRLTDLRRIVEKLVALGWTEADYKDDDRLYDATEYHSLVLQPTLLTDRSKSR